MKNIISLSFVMLFMVQMSCKEATKAEELATADAKEMVAATDKQTASSPETAPTETYDRKLIKDGTISFETESIKNTRKTIYNALKKYNGYVSTDQETTDDTKIKNTITLRIPSKNYDLFLEEALAGVEHLDEKNINVNDVTEEFLDSSARLKTKKELESRYISLLSKATKIADILEIEQHIANERGEIEAIEGRLKYIENRVSLGTLTLEFYQTVPTQNTFGKSFSEGFENGWKLVVWGFVMLSNLWVFILLILLFLGIRTYRKRNKQLK